MRTHPSPPAPRRFALLAAGALTLALCACEAPAGDGAPGTAAATAAGEAAAAALKIGHVNTDSVLAQYTYLAEQTDILRQRESDATASLERKQRRLGEQEQAFLRRAQSGDMTPKAIENEQAALQRNAQELQAEYQRLAGEFQGETIRLQNELGIVLKRVVEEIQAEQGYDYILNYGSSGAVLAINPAYDLTAAVVARMNAGDAPAIGGADSVAIGVSVPAGE